MLNPQFDSQQIKNGLSYEQLAEKNARELLNKLVFSDKLQDHYIKQVNTDLCADMAFEIFLIRQFEQILLELWAQGCIHGPLHTSIGQEACAAGAMAALSPEDKIISTHRAHHHYLAKLVTYYTAKQYHVVRDEFSPNIQEQINMLMGEIMGLSIGCCGGRGGSMHLRNNKIGIVGTNAIVGGGIPLATGVAFSSQYKKQPVVVVCFMGDGAVNQGAFHEALNLAGIWKLPIIYFIENNLYAVGTAIKNSTATKNLAEKGSSYGIPAVITDGMNPVAVMKTVQKAADWARNGKGPTLIEAKCYRFMHHAGATPGSAYGYRTKTEEQKWLQRDPYITFPRNLIEQNILTPEQLSWIRGLAYDAVKTAREYCTRCDNGKYIVKKELWPNPVSVASGIRSDNREFIGIENKEIADFSEFETKTYVQAIADVTARHLEKNPDVFILGEEVANFNGGPYGATKGLYLKYPRRILNTPISECGFIGLAGGCALSGLRPIAEIMFPDFALVAADQLFNQVGKLRYMYGNNTSIPLVVRTRIAIGCGYGAQHSLDPVGLFSLFSGWRIVAPANAFDYIGLFNSAMQSADPVLIIEHHSLYPHETDVPKGNLDYFIPFGKARIVKYGRDVTALCYSSTVNLAMKSATDLISDGISVEVIDLRTLNPMDIDYHTIGDSFKKTNAMVIIEQAPASMSLAPVIIAECQKRYFDYFDCPIATINGLDIPNPVSRVLETAALPNLAQAKSILARTAQRG